MKSAIIFGATDTGKRIYHDIKNEYNIIGFVDGNPKLVGQECEGFIIRDCQSLNYNEYDYIIIGVLTRYSEIKEEIINMGIPEYKIIGKYVEIAVQSRIEFLKNIGDIINKNNIGGSVAELGVYQGEFAKCINKVFSDRKLYLFDTFAGLPQYDAEYDNNKGFATANQGHFSNTSEQIVLNKMKYSDNCIICKGYFPETTKGIDDTFCFVNLDADLYKPTLDGLQFFYPKMKKNGVILIHDYFSSAFKGVRYAVDQFTSENNIKFLPIGDTLSVAIIK
ncbi:TylF/MycF/NovP-related O-methyltransferase [Clostridium butyricum]|uniref:TylF/MycF/NovP-related O-methyltransferase n=1 Tax=Clostridium butyricum TaxID=1492 RepID=UPI0013D3A1B2|nr:TylF/MycF/NovP-related O-methyltransferase [Clostridium butyricum]MCQ2022954.1 TylF/MycF family methyltransferase [Clostridium butyricum]